MWRDTNIYLTPEYVLCGSGRHLKDSVFGRNSDISFLFFCRDISFSMDTYDPTTHLPIVMNYTVEHGLFFTSFFFLIPNSLRTSLCNRVTLTCYDRLLARFSCKKLIWCRMNTCLKQLYAQVQSRTGINPKTAPTRFSRAETFFHE